MTYMIRITFVLIACFAILMTVGCASKEVKQGYSGFLMNYPMFEPGPEDGVNQVYFKDSVDFKKYNKIMMDHVVFYLSDEAKDKGIEADTLKELSDVFHEAVIESLKDAYPVVDKPGADVMRIRLAITELVPADVSKTLVTSVMPYGTGTAVKVVKYAATGTYSFVGETAMEVEVLDSLTNERIAAAIDRRSKVKKIKITEGMTKWGETKDIFEFWAKRLKLWLDETHGRS